MQSTMDSYSNMHVEMKALVTLDDVEPFTTVDDEEIKIHIADGTTS